MKERLPSEISRVDVNHSTTGDSSGWRLIKNRWSNCREFYTWCHTCARSMTSNMTDMEGVRAMISPDARQSFLLSSNTVLRFSIQTASTGPSNIIHFRPVYSEVDNSLYITKRTLNLFLGVLGIVRFILPKYERYDSIYPFVSHWIKLAKQQTRCDGFRI